MRINNLIFSKRMLFFILLVIAAILSVAGCAKLRNTSKASDKNAYAKQAATPDKTSRSGYESKWITDISFGSDGGNFNVYIKGNRLLPYTSVKQVSPAALFLYFTDTALSTDKTDLVVNNDIIETIRATDVAEKNRETVKVEILLSKKFPNLLPYIISRDGPGIKIAFQRGTPVSADADNQGGDPGADSGKFTRQDTDSSGTVSTEDTRGTISARQASTVLAGRLDSVYAARFDDGLKVFVGADGMITKYKAYTNANPPRIIFDIFDVKSPYAHEKVIPVNSPWVKMVRYQSYPDRLNLILETFPQYLNAYSASPVDNGLMVHVGQGSFPKQAPGTNVALPDTVNFNRDSSSPTNLDGAERSSVASNQTAQPQGVANLERNVGVKDNISYKTASPKSSEKLEGETDYTQPAYVNQIDILKEESGTSGLAMETSRPVKYEVKRIGDKKLEFKLFNTQIPDDLQRSLTSKTDKLDEGGVFRQLTPFKPGPGNSSINIDMREDIPYTVEQSGQRLMLKFARTSSSQPAVKSEPVSETPAAPAETTPIIAQSSPPAQAQTSTQFQVQAIPATQPEPIMPAIPKGKGYVQPSAPAATSAPVVASVAPISKDSELKLDIKENAPKYTGEKIALDFYETDIKNVFRILREVSNMNFAVDKDVSGKVTLTLAEPVPWDQVLDLVLKMNKLGKTVDGTVIRIATAKTLDDEEKVRRDQKKSAMEANVVHKQLEPFITEYLSVNYSDAEKEILPLVKEILSKDRGDSKDKATVSVDKRTNMVVITDIPDVVRRAKELIGKIDRVTPQVMIEARIVEATTSFSREIGTKWGSNIGIQNSDKTAGIGPEKGYDTFGGTYGYNMLVNLPTSATASGALGFNFMRIAGTPFSLDATLMAMESKGEGKIVSSPKVLTMDNKKATIKQGFKYPYYTRDASGLSNLSFEEVVLLLDVTPHVTPDNRISILMNIDKKDLGDVINTVQSFTVKEAKTELLINDGETVVIGGIVKQTENASNSGIPGLSKIPLLGWLFKSKASKDLKEELLIFITPRIVQLEQRAVQN